MKTRLTIICALAFLLAGCESIKDQVQTVIELTSKVGNVKYHRSGLWTEADLTIERQMDGSRTAYFKEAVKVPGGPSISITIEGIRLDP